MTGKMHKQQQIHGPVHHFVHALGGGGGGGGWRVRIYPFNSYAN